MLFNSYEFCLLFLPLVLLGFGMAQRRSNRAFTLGWLLVASVVFYAWSSASALGLLGGSIALNYTAGRAIDAQGNPNAARVRWLTTLGVAANLGILGLAKYLEFFVEAGAALLGHEIPLTRAIPPLAISFFTFQQIAYLVDVSRGHPAERNGLRYALFVCFFPQLIAGPIVHHKEVLPQFEASRLGFDPRHVALGTTLFAIGLAKKVLIADTIVAWVDPVFAGAASGAIGFADAWAGALTYTLQLYFDFSGYCDMAIGLGLLFGIRLPTNFDSPYQATSVIDFWRRWHQTLSRFLRDYLYIPLGGNRRGRLRRYANLLITMLLGGLWHGASWTFVVWGGLHGLYLVSNHGWRALTGAFGHTPASNGLTRAAARSLTLLCVVVAWVFFRADSLSTAVAMLEGMAGLTGNAAGAGGAGGGVLFDGAQWAGVLALLFLVSFAPNSQQIVGYRPFGATAPMRDAVRERDRRPWPRLRFRPSAPWAAITAGLLLMAFVGMSDAREFVYFRF